MRDSCPRSLAYFKRMRSGAVARIEGASEFCARVRRIAQEIDLPHITDPPASSKPAALSEVLLASACRPQAASRDGSAARGCAPPS